MDITWIKMLAEQGVLVGLAAALITVFILIVKNTISTSNKIAQEAAQERKVWQEQDREERLRWFGIIDNLSRSIQEHSIQAKDFHDSSREANKFQRDEHAKILEGINEVLTTFTAKHNDRNKECLSIISKLDSIEKVIVKCEK